MNWKQRFKAARKNVTFDEDDVESASLLSDSAVGDKLRSMGYNMSFTSDQLEIIVDKLDNDLRKMEQSFFESVEYSETLSGEIDYYDAYSTYHSDCMDAIDDAEKYYNEIQDKTLTQDIIDVLSLKETPVE